MLIEGKPFPGSASYVDKHTTLLSRPVMPLGLPSSYPSIFLPYGPSTNSCFTFTGIVYVVLWWAVLYYTLPFSDFLRAVSIFMVFHYYHPNIRLNFEMGLHEIQHFIMGFFHFELLQTHQDTCIYRVSCGYFNTIVCFVGVDTDSRCNYRSNVDFVHFVWENF